MVRWRVASASEIGTSHISSELPCQDYCEHRIIRSHEGQIMISVVCDGAGSAAHSDIGAWLAATTIVEFAEVYFEGGGRLFDIDRQTMASWIEQTAQRLLDRADADGNPAGDYACTLLVAIVGLKGAVFAQIGDGAIVVSHGEEDGWNWVFWPHHGEYANQTVFILSKNAVEAMQFELAPRRIDEFAVFSDGIERMVLHAATKSVNDKFFDHMLGPVRLSRSRGNDRALSDQLKSYLGSAAVNARTNDDKTLVLATRRPLPRAPV